MILEHVLTHGLFYSIVVTGYLFITMVATSPRVWGYNDYPQSIKDKVSPQTKTEKKLAIIISIPWFIFIFGFPIYSTLILKTKLTDEIPVLISFFNLYMLFLFASMADLIILDWLIVSKITPGFVIIPGTEKKDYQDFSHHIRHIKATLIMISVLLIPAAIISLL